MNESAPMLIILILMGYVFFIMEAYLNDGADRAAALVGRLIPRQWTCFCSVFTILVIGNHGATDPPLFFTFLWSLYVSVGIVIVLSIDDWAKRERAKLVDQAIIDSYVRTRARDWK